MSMSLSRFEHDNLVAELYQAPSPDDGYINNRIPAIERGLHIPIQFPSDGPSPSLPGMCLSKHANTRMAELPQCYQRSEWPRLNQPTPLPRRHVLRNHLRATGTSSRRRVLKPSRSPGSLLPESEGQFATNPRTNNLLTFSAPLPNNLRNRPSNSRSSPPLNDLPRRHSRRRRQPPLD